jgi:hypothetical protein
MTAKRWFHTVGACGRRSARKPDAGLPRFDGQGLWLGQATCLRTSWSVVSNASGGQVAEGAVQAGAVVQSVRLRQA